MLDAEILECFARGITRIRIPALNIIEVGLELIDSFSGKVQLTAVLNFPFVAFENGFDPCIRPGQSLSSCPSMLRTPSFDESPHLLDDLPVGAGSLAENSIITNIEENRTGRETRIIHGQTCSLEYALTPDFALVHACI